MRSGRVRNRHRLEDAESRETKDVGRGRVEMPAVESCCAVVEPMDRSIRWSAIAQLSSSTSTTTTTTTKGLYKEIGSVNFRRLTARRAGLSSSTRRRQKSISSSLDFVMCTSLRLAYIQDDDDLTKKTFRLLFSNLREFPPLLRHFGLGTAVG